MLGFKMRVKTSQSGQTVNCQVKNWSTARVNGHICSIQTRCSGHLGVPLSLSHTLVNIGIIGRLSNYV
ncbi:hypothetical protein HanPI659440_Chr05g0192401 [Helianthus annuus]|nr:hypothetical protein HanPI659440_Chr05g0192401 [Helianthus annuus]